MADGTRPAAAVDAAAWTCPAPLRDHARVVLGHGGGGKLSGDLVAHLFLPAFGGDVLGRLGDAAVLDVPPGRLAVSTDSFVVRPLFFPGGDIGTLAVNGTVNDVAMSGARPLYLSAGFILEEGLPLDVLGAVTANMAAAAERAGVAVVTGDTKVVDRGHGDGLYVNTAGIGVVPEGVDVGPERARPGDAVVVSGPIGLHGVAVMSVREGLEFGTVVESDCAPLNGLVADMLAVTRDVHCLRDPTRGGVAATLNEIAAASGVGVDLDEAAIPVPEAVAAACGFLGLDPLSVANEGKLVAFVPEAAADDVVERMRTRPEGAGAVRIGRVTEEHPGTVVARTAIGGTRIVDLPLGEQLPRIC